MTLRDAIGIYGPTSAGLAIGTAAKYGLTINEGRPLSWRGVLADLLLLGMLGLLAIAIADWLALTGNARVLAGALAAVSSDRLVRLARDRFMRRVEVETSALGDAARAAEVTKVPAGNGEPDMIGVQPGVPDSAKARVGATLQAIHRRATTTRPPEDQIEMLRNLDGIE